MQEEFKKGELLFATLESELVDIVFYNPGIRQTAIFNMYDPEAKEFIRCKINKLTKKNIINKENSGNTYILTVTEKI